MLGFYPVLPAQAYARQLSTSDRVRILDGRYREKLLSFHSLIRKCYGLKWWASNKFGNVEMGK